MYHALPLVTFDHESVGVLVSGRDGRICYCNRAAGYIFRCDPRAIVGKPCNRVARFRLPGGGSFCAVICPIRRRIGEARFNSLRRLVLHAGGHCRMEVDLLTFLAPAARPEQPRVLHLLWPVQTNTRDAPSALAPLIRRSHAGRRAALRLPSLTTREREVLEALASGMGITEIAAALAISRTTVRNHVQRTLGKLRVHRQLDAVLALRDAGGPLARG